MSAIFPNITVAGDPVRAKDHVEKGTGLYVLLAYFAAAIGLIIGIAASYGVLLVVILFYPLFASFIRKKALAQIHGSGVRISENQFPEIHRSLMSLKERLGITQDVRAYIVEANVLNALTVRYGKNNLILLTDDLIQGCLVSDNPKALSWIMAHELGHIALNHTGLFRASLSKAVKKLSRLDEYSCDTVACALMKDDKAAYTGLLLLTVGWALLPYVNHQELIAQAGEVARNKYSKKAERPMTHPMVLNRIHRIMPG